MAGVTNEQHAGQPVPAAGAVSPVPADEAGAEGAPARSRGVNPVFIMVGIVVLMVAVIGIASAFRQEAPDSIQGGTRMGTGQLVPSGVSVGQTLKVGGVAPDFTLMDTSGRLVALADFRGRPVVLNFWATWCPPCRSEMPELQDQHERRPEVAIVGVNLREDPAHVARFIGNAGYTWSFLLDDGTVSQQYAIAALPSTFFIGPDGVIQEIRVGGMNRKEIEQRVAKLAAGAGS